jgi:hypothetical protein
MPDSPSGLPPKSEGTDDALVVIDAIIDGIGNALSSLGESLLDPAQGAFIAQAVYWELKNEGLLSPSRGSVET